MAKTRIKKHWYDYLWIWSILYLALGFFNILFAWLGLLDFILPLIFAIVGGNKWFCNHICGRGQLLWVLGRNMGFSRKKQAPSWISSKCFRYVFLAFFMTMFGTMIFQTYMVFSGADSLRKVVKLFWTFKVPWKWAYNGSIFPDWVAQFGFGFYSMMLTSTLIGIIFMVIYKERTWCSFCPMGTMTQGICKIKAKKGKESYDNK